MKNLDDVKNDHYVLITGASGGIGYEMAKVFAENGFHLILVARSEDKLQQIAREFEEEYAIQAHGFACDLSLTGEIDKLYKKLKANNLNLCMLVNNAGFGYWGHFEEMEPDNQIEMLELNVVGLTYFTRLVVKDMIANGFGKILNVASIAAFQPIPYAASYAATKSYVLSFSLALDAEVKEKNVRVSALCPPDVESGFQKTAGQPGFKPTGIYASSAEHVAQVAYAEFMENKPMIRPWKLPAKCIMFFDRFMPKQVGIEVSKFILKSRIS